MTTINGNLTMCEMFNAVDHGLTRMVRRADVSAENENYLAHAAFANYSLHARVCGTGCATESTNGELLRLASTITVEQFEFDWKVVT